MADNVYRSSTCSLVAGQVPVIRAPRGNAAEMVATKLDKKLRDNIRDMRHSLFNTDMVQAGQFRCLFSLNNRSLELRCVCLCECLHVLVYICVWICVCMCVRICEKKQQL